MTTIFHQVAMWSIFIGGLILLYLALLWFLRANYIMALGMFVMSLLALSNFYLHRKQMKNK